MAGRLARLVPADDRFGLVLLTLVASYLATAVGGSTAPRLVEGAFAMLSLWLALRASAVPRRVLRGGAVLLLGAFAVLWTTSVVVDTRTAQGLFEVWIALILLVTLGAVLRRVLSHREVTLETLAGALSAYLLLGMTFGAFYGILADLSGSQLLVQSADPSVALRQYFSFTTLTTLGYGDLTAATDVGRAISSLEAIAGQVFLATLIARLVTNFSGRRPTSGD